METRRLPCTLLSIMNHSSSYFSPLLSWPKYCKFTLSLSLMVLLILCIHGIPSNTFVFFSLFFNLLSSFGIHRAVQKVSIFLTCFRYFMEIGYLLYCLILDIYIASLKRQLFWFWMRLDVNRTFRYDELQNIVVRVGCWNDIVSGPDVVYRSSADLYSTLHNI